MITGKQTHRQILRRFLVVGGLVAITATVSVAPAAETVRAAAAPGIGTATSNASQTVDLSWTAPSPSTGLLGYEILPQINGVNQTLLKVALPSSSLSATISGLDNGVAYTFIVRAVFPSGVYTSAPSNSVVPFGLPSAATGISAVGGDGKLDVSWTPAQPNGSSVTQYEVVVTPGPFTVSVGGSTTTTPVTGLENGKSYTVTVTAYNARGSTISTQASGKPVGPPASPSLVSATVGNGSVTISWAAPVQTGGEDLTGYSIAMTGGATETISVSGGGTLSYTKNSLVNGTSYTFTVSAINAQGLTSEPSSPASATPAVAAIPALNASGVTPNSGPIAGGQAIDLVGSNLSTVTHVDFACVDGTKRVTTLGAPTTSRLSVQTPACSAGVASITATTGAGTSNGVNFFYFAPPTIVAISPAEGPRLGGNSIVISGTGFVPGSTAVKIGGKTALVEGSSPSSLTVSVPALLPAETAGARDVQVVVNSSAGLTATLAAAYTYLAPQNDSVGIVPPLPLPSPSRISGSTRFDTSAQLSAQYFSPGVDVAFVATGRAFADALAAGPVASGQGPVLIVEPTAIPAAVATELTRLRPQRIVILGGNQAVSSSLELALSRFTSGSVSRIGGANRYETAVQASATRFGSNVPIVFVATGSNFADALGAGAAAQGRGPVLLTTRDSLPAVTRDEISRLQPRRIVVLGGTSVISESVRQELAGLTGLAVERLGGSDRYETMALLAADSYRLTGGTVMLATGAQYADALSAAPTGVPVLLVRPTCIPSAVANQLTRLNPSRVIALGGSAALSEAATSYVVC